MKASIFTLVFALLATTVVYAEDDAAARAAWRKENREEMHAKRDQFRAEMDAAKSGEERRDIVKKYRGEAKEMRQEKRKAYFESLPEERQQKIKERREAFQNMSEEEKKAVIEKRRERMGERKENRREFMENRADKRREFRNDNSDGSKSFKPRPRHGRKAARSSNATQ